jgi:hypothetical protein
MRRPFILDYIGFESHFDGLVAVIDVKFHEYILAVEFHSVD